MLNEWVSTARRTAAAPPWAERTRRTNWTGGGGRQASSAAVAAQANAEGARTETSAAERLPKRIDVNALGGRTNATRTRTLFGSPRRSPVSQYAGNSCAACSSYDRQQCWIQHGHVRKPSSYWRKSRRGLCYGMERIRVSTATRARSRPGKRSAQLWDSAKRNVGGKWKVSKAPIGVNGEEYLQQRMEVRMLRFVQWTCL